MHFAELEFQQISIRQRWWERDGSPIPYAKTTCPQIFNEYDTLAKTMVERASLEEMAKDLFFHFMLDLEGGPCVAKRLSGCGSGTGTWR